MRKILVLRGGALGDFLVTLPALALLRARWPAATIELVGNATAAALAVDAGLLTRAHSQHESRWSALHAAAPLPCSFARELATFDLVINFWPDPDGDLARHFQKSSALVFLSSSALPTIAPAAAHYCALLHKLGLTPTAFVHSLATPSPAAHFIALHPGSGSSQKNWTLSRWVKICEYLTCTPCADLLIITGEADTAAASALARFGIPAHQLPLRELVVRLTQCRLFLGHDSGISHLAAACGVPSLLLFGPTDPAVWAPPAPNVTVIQRGPTLRSISVADVLAQLPPM